MPGKAQVLVGASGFALFALARMQDCDGYVAKPYQ